MRSIFFFLFLVIALGTKGQLSVIVNPADTTLCPGDSLALTTVITGFGPFTYQWQHNGSDIPGAKDSVLIFPKTDVFDTGVYHCMVSNGMDTETSNPAYLRLHPKMKIDTLFRYNELGCRGVCKGQFKVLVSGGLPPYEYHWGGGHSQDTIVFGLCPGRYTLIVTDSNGCSIDTNYFVDVLRSPKIDFTLLPSDTIFLTNPTISVNFPDSSKALMANWEWDFGDEAKVANVNPVNHTYSKTGTYPVFLSFKDLNGCDTVVMHEVVVKLLNLMIPNVITPNGDGKNDTFEFREKVGDNNYQEIDLLEVYLSNELVIVDRWGRKVFSQMNYKSGDWDGENLGDGVYYYVFKGIGQFGNDLFHGSVTILRSPSSQ